VSFIYLVFMFTMTTLLRYLNYKKIIRSLALKVLYFQNSNTGDPELLIYPPVTTNQFCTSFEITHAPVTDVNSSIEKLAPPLNGKYLS